MKSKFLFIRVEQSLALEVLGYILCAFVGFQVATMIGYKHWQAYVYATMAVMFTGAIYRILVAHRAQLIRVIQSVYERTTIFLCRLAGKRGLTLNREKTRYAVVGTSLFIPALMSFYTFPYLLQTSWDMKLSTSYLVTILLAFIIFLVDRTFVATMGWKKIWYGVLARLILAIALGLFLSKPIELQLFNKETTEELKVQKQEKLAKIEDDRIAAIQRIDVKEANAMKELNRARQEYETEINTSVGGRRAGHGKEAGKKEAYYNEQFNLYNTNVAPLIAKERFTTDSLYNAMSTEYQKTQSYGYGARAAALEAAGKKYPAIAFNAWLIVLTLIMLDISPLLAKLLMPKSQSDREEQKEEEQSEYEVKSANIKQKYGLMGEEINEALKMINNLDLPEDQKGRLIQYERNRIRRQYFGHEVLN